MVENLLNNAERFFRWVYPGFLLLTLVHFGQTNSVDLLRLSSMSDAVTIFALLVGAIVSSFIIYTIYRYLIYEVVIRYCILYLLWKTKSSELVYAKKLGRKEVRNSPWGFGLLADELSQVAAEKLSHAQREQEFHAWGFTHATGMSFWLVLLGVIYADPGSTLNELGFTRQAVVVVMLGVAWLWQLIRHLAGNFAISERLADKDRGA